MNQDIPHAAVELKEKANAFFRKSSFNHARSVYKSILEQFGDSIPAPFARVVRCNLAACFIELREYENALKSLDPIFLTPTSKPIPLHEQEADPIFHKAHFRQARCLLELGNTILALAALDTYRDLVKGKVDDMEPVLRADIMQGILEAKQSVESDQNLRHLRYEIFVDGHDKPFVKHTTVPSDLCCRIPPRDRGIAFLVGLMDIYETSILNSFQPGDRKCWNCGKPATTLAHTPRLQLYLPPEEGGPLVRDYVRPICARHSECDGLAKDGTKLVNGSMNGDAAVRVVNGYGFLS